jgi:hypothetical protein
LLPRRNARLREMLMRYEEVSRMNALFLPREPIYKRTMKGKEVLEALVQIID